MKMSWRDEYLTWDPAEHNDVEILFVPEEKIWTFDLTLYSSISATAVEMDHDRLMVRPDGKVTWYSAVVFNSSCLVRVRFFPFDKQYCRLILASWAYDNTLVHINEIGRNLTGNYFITNGVWDLSSIEKVDLLQKWSCCPNPWSEVHYLIIFKRQAAYYVITVIVPGTSLSLVSLLVFSMPPDSEEKLTLASSNLLAMLLFQELVSTSMPPIGNEFSLIGAFLVASVVITTLSIFASLLILYLHKKDNRPVPTWLRKLTVLKTGSNQSQPVNASPNWVDRRLPGVIGTISSATDVHHRRPNTSLGASSVGFGYGKQSTDTDEPSTNGHNDIRKRGSHNADEGSDYHLITRNQIVAQWQEVALKVNRMMAFLFTSSIMLTGLAITFLYIAQEEEALLKRN